MVNRGNGGSSDNCASESTNTIDSWPSWNPALTELDAMIDRGRLTLTPEETGQHVIVQVTAPAARGASLRPAAVAASVLAGLPPWARAIVVVCVSVAAAVVAAALALRGSS